MFHPTKLETQRLTCCLVCNYCNNSTNNKAAAAAAAPSTSSSNSNSNKYSSLLWLVLTLHLLAFEATRMNSNSQKQWPPPSSRKSPTQLPVRSPHHLCYIHPTSALPRLQVATPRVGGASGSPRPARSVAAASAASRRRGGRRRSRSPRSSPRANVTT